MRIDILAATATVLAVLFGLGSVAATGPVHGEGAMVAVPDGAAVVY